MFLAILFSLVEKKERVVCMKFLWGLILGLGLGYVLGLLFAPQSGEATRALLAEQGIQLREGNLNEELRQRAQEAMVQGKEAYKRTKEELNERFSKVRSGEF
jgi:gas vesicle protein